MQSGYGKNRWIFEYYQNNDKITENLMGWTGSKDTMEQIRLYFETAEDAVRYAKENNIDFDLIEDKKKKYGPKSYSDNFRFKRKDQWTH